MTVDHKSVNFVGLGWVQLQFHIGYIFDPLGGLLTLWSSPGKIRRFRLRGCGGRGHDLREAEMSQMGLPESIFLAKKAKKMQKAEILESFLGLN